MIVIPDYQRPYSWQTEHCEKLWYDIENFSQENMGNTQDYFSSFTGNLHEIKTDGEKSSR